MKTLLITISSIFVLAACTHTGADRSEANIAIVEKYIDAVEAGDYAAIESMIADDYVGNGPSVGDTTNKVDGMAAWKYNLENIYEKVEYERSRNLAITVTDGEYPGDWVTNVALVSITYKDGRGPVKLFASTLYKIEDGKISNTFTVYNENDVLEQLGMN